ncbi:hypothetical protein [Laspinema palackyanum]|uniref:hypothetical protein n=1 Tax=Laspinema palackyanum TaxID=3231601 RepID=UPI00345CB5D7|nr:hypothetical protein [Laspinema sp. D2c]
MSLVVYHNYKWHLHYPKEDPVLWSQIFKRLSSLGCIHQHSSGASDYSIGEGIAAKNRVSEL